MLSPIAYLTCELKGRDLDSRFLIAAHLAKLGLYAVVGDYWSSLASATVAPKGCYLFKTTNSVQAAAIEGCARLGHRVIAADEEAMSQNEAFAHMTTDPRAAEHCDRYLAVNEAHKRGILKAFPVVRGKISVVGSARFDILRAARTQRPRPAPYVLVNMVFGMVNGTWGDLETAIDVYRRALKPDLSDPDSRRQVDERLHYEREAMREVQAFISQVLAETTIDVVVRPHPSERPEYWEELYAGNSRVEVVGRSDPVPWIQHAALMVHCDSTTGIEAAILGTPCINLSPDEGWARRLVIPEANYSVRDGVAAATAAKTFLETGKLEVAPRRADELFPVNGAQKTARAIAEMLPKPKKALTELNWNRIERTDLQRDKFTVSPDEAQAAMMRMFTLANVRPRTLTRLDESAYLVRPDA
ncbi:MAG: hypothetical protein K1X51_13250 [Rhodospirillaceae bacterium]|nr:hypothetical protein [Rhodospirillaceae bacterium]